MDVDTTKFEKCKSFFFFGITRLFCTFLMNNFQSFCSFTVVTEDRQNMADKHYNSSIQNLVILRVCSLQESIYDIYNPNHYSYVKSIMIIAKKLFFEIKSLQLFNFRGAFYIVSKIFVSRHIFTARKNKLHRKLVFAVLAQ